MDVTPGKRAEFRNAPDLGHCQCSQVAGRECNAVPTAEDLLCDNCRTVRADPDWECCVFLRNGERIDGGVHRHSRVNFYAAGIRLGDLGSVHGE